MSRLNSFPIWKKTAGCRCLWMKGNPYRSKIACPLVGTLPIVAFGSSSREITQLLYCTPYMLISSMKPLKDTIVRPTDRTTHAPTHTHTHTHASSGPFSCSEVASYTGKLRRQRRTRALALQHARSRFVAVHPQWKKQRLLPARHRSPRRATFK
jgi:hypothetical protein